MSISKLLRPACVAVTALFLLHGPAGAKTGTSTEAPLPAASGILDEARPAVSTKLAQRRGHDGVGIYFGLPYYYPYYYGYPGYYSGYYYRPYRPYRRRYGRRCGYWHDRCVANWGYRNSNYYGCMRYHGCR